MYVRASSSNLDQRETIRYIRGKAMQTLRSRCIWHSDPTRDTLHLLYVSSFTNVRVCTL